MSAGRNNFAKKNINRNRATKFPPWSPTFIILFLLELKLNIQFFYIASIPIYTLYSIRGAIHKSPTSLLWQKYVGQLSQQKRGYRGPVQLAHRQRVK